MRSTSTPWASGRYGASPPPTARAPETSWTKSCGCCRKTVPRRTITLLAQATASGNTVAKFTWTKVKGASGYDVFLGKYTPKGSIPMKKSVKGGNKQSALMMGINVRRTKFLSHLICSILAGIGGYVYFLHVGSGSASHAMGMEMNAIASSIIGGTMLTGGVGNIIGTLFGVLSLSTIQNIVASAGLDQAWWTGITIAAMLCIFLIIQSVVMAQKKKALKS